MGLKKLGADRALEVRCSLLGSAHFAASVLVSKIGGLRFETAVLEGVPRDDPSRDRAFTCIEWECGFDSRRGYTICDVTPDRWRATFRAVADPFDEDSAVSTISEWQIAAGTPGAQPVA